MRKIRLLVMIVTLCWITIIISACKPVSNINIDLTNTEINTTNCYDTSTIPSTSNDQSEIISNSECSQEVSSISEDVQEIKNDYEHKVYNLIESEYKKVIINADLKSTVSDEYIVGRMQGSIYDEEKMMEAFWGERASKFVDSGNGFYTLDPDTKTGCYSTAGFGEKFRFDTHYFNNNPELANRILNQESNGCTMTAEKAIELCEKFLSESDISDYNLYDIEYYGKISSPYYKLIYTFTYNDNWVNAYRLGTSITFCVCDDGIVEIEGCFLDVKNLIISESYNIADLLSVDDAMNKMAEQIDSAGVWCSPYSPFFKYFSDEGLGLLEIPICEIYLGYCYNNTLITPAWLFIVGDEEFGRDGSILLAVDAISGRMIT